MFLRYDVWDVTYSNLKNKIEEFNKKMNIILLAAGKDEKSHIDYPKFLTEIFSKTLLSINWIFY